MRFIDTTSLDFKEVVNYQSVKYAILSHRWQDGEVTYKEMTKDHARIKHKTGYQKIVAFCKLAKELSYGHVWIDTCCIDKRSSAELSEAINSMFLWYAHARVCIVYLYDIGLHTALSDLDNWEAICEKEPSNVQDTFSRSSWFTRAWTLQELISPASLRFYDCDWDFIGTRDSLALTLSVVTGIPQDVLTKSTSFREYPIAERMFWAGKRQCERIEDVAYSLLGLFDVNMPLLYGEGSKAFVRLQEQIIRQSNDQSIFIWHVSQSQLNSGWFLHSTLFAPHPSCFSGHWQYRPHQDGVKPYSMTNSGLSINMWLQPWTPGVYLGLFQCDARLNIGDNDWNQAGIYLQKVGEEGLHRRIVVSDKTWDSILRRAKSPLGRQQDVYIDSVRLERFHWRTSQLHGIRIGDICPLSTPHHDRAQFFEDNVKVYTNSEFSPHNRIVESPDGWHGTVAVISLRKGVGRTMATIILGFDFEFRPICIVGKDSLLSGIDDVSWKDIFYYFNAVCWSQTSPLVDGVVDLNWRNPAITVQGRYRQKVWRAIQVGRAADTTHDAVAVLLSKDGQPFDVSYKTHITSIPGWTASITFRKQTATARSEGNRTIFEFNLFFVDF